MRRFGTPPVTGATYTNRPGAYGIIRRGRDLLVTHQAKPFFEFQLPGGGIDAGENATTALRREAYEETGWTIDIERKLGAFVYYTYMSEYDISARKVCHIFLCRAVMQKSEPLEPGHTAVWMSPKTAAVQVFNPGDRAFIKALQL